MKKTAINLTLIMALAFLCARLCDAAQITDLQVFSSDSYARIAISLDQQIKPNIEVNAGEKLVFVRFDGTGIEGLEKQSFVYEDNPHLESVAFLPLGSQATVVRVKGRHPFSVKTYETKTPQRFVLEIQEKGSSSGTTATLSNSGFDRDYYRRGVSQLQKGNYNAALMSFRGAIRAGERVADSYYQAGLIRFKLGQKENALINFRRAQESSSYGDDARLYQSWIHYLNNDQPSLKNSWKTFAANMPDENDRVSLATGHPEIDYRAIEAAINSQLENKVHVKDTPENKSVRDDEKAAIFFAKGMAAREKGNLEEAVTMLEQAVSLNDSYPEAHFQLGVVYKALGKNKLSADHFEKSLVPTAYSDPALVDMEDTGFSGDEVSDDTFQDDFTAGNTELSKDNLMAFKGKDVKSGGLMDDSDNAENTGDGSIDNAQLAAVPGVKMETDKGESSIIGSIRQAANEMIALPNVSLLKKQVKILTVILGLLFLLTLISEKIVLRRFRSAPALITPNFGNISDSQLSGRTSGSAKIANPLSTGVQKKRQMEAVLARELAAKKQDKSKYHAEEARNNDMEIHLQSAEGMYGIDIARRIKAELARENNNQEQQAFSFTGKQDDMRTRLIRQLRSKNWTISDIAQEMDLSREEIKWALSNDNFGKQEKVTEVSTRSDKNGSYGQARNLIGLKKEKYESISPKSIDREVDLELEINV